MTDPTTTTIPSDLRTHRHPIQIDDDGRLFALQVQGAQQGAVILMTRDGGLAVLPGTTIEQLLRPTADEPGAGRLAAALKRLGALEIDGIDGGSATPTDRLEAAIEEYAHYLHNVKPDLAVWSRTIEDADTERRKIRALAIDAITSGDPSQDFGGGALDLVQQLAQYTTAWRDGALDLVRLGLVQTGAAKGPGEFFKGLRNDLPMMRGIASDCSAAAVEFFKGEPEPDPFMLTRAPDRAVSQVETLAATAAKYRAEVARVTDHLRQVGEDHVEARKMLDRVAELVGCDQKREDVIGCVRELVREHKALEAEVLTLRAGQIVGTDPPSPEVAADFAKFQKFDPKPVIEKARASARGVLELLAPEAAEAVRVNYPGAAVLRVLVPASVGEDVLSDIESEVAMSVGGDLGEDMHLIVEVEPGKPPEGWAVGEVAPGVWAYFLEADASSATKAADEAEAVDAAWREEASEMERDA